MSENWVETTLGEVADWKAGGTPPATNRAFYDGGTIPWAVIGDVNNRAIESTSNTITDSGLERIGGTKKVAPVGSVLLTMYGSVGRSGIAKIPVATNQAITWGVPKLDLISSEFLFCTLSGREADFDALARGATQRNINKGMVLGFPVVLPPLATQRRIVAVIDCIDKQIAALDAERDALHRARKSLLDSLMQRKDDWERQSLGAIAEVKLGRMLSKERAAGPHQAPYVRNANVQWDGLNLNDLKSMSFPEDERIKYELKSGDILTCEGGDPGRSVLLDEDLDGIFFQKAIHRVRAIHVQPEYLFEAIVLAYENGTIDDLCTVTTIAHLTAEKFKRLQICVPPVEDQFSISKTIGSIRKQIQSLRIEHSQLQDTRSVILNALLSREIEIPESFDELLKKKVAV